MEKDIFGYNVYSENSKDHVLSRPTPKLIRETIFFRYDKINSKFSCPLKITVSNADDPTNSEDLLGELNIAIDNYTKFDKVETIEFGSLNDSYFYRLQYKVMIDN